MTEAATVDLVVFELSGRRHALLASCVYELVRAVALEPLADAPPLVHGVINVRGTLVPVLDVRPRLSLASRPLRSSDHLLICAARGARAALAIDRALELLAVPLADVHRTEDVQPGLPLVAGLARLPDGVLVIYDLDQFLSAAEQDALERALAAARNGAA